MKKLFTLILFITLFSVINLNAASSGKLNSSIFWTLSDDGTLTISGTGYMPDFSASNSPFYKNSNIRKVIINHGVTSLGNYVFRGCSSLTSITIPNSVTDIGNYAFSGCSSLTSITIPNSVTYIGSWAFYNCSGLTSITIPNSVTIIGRSAFSGCSGLTSITIPNSVTSISESVFSGCSSLTSITIPNSVTSIGYYAFSGCSGLTSITIPNSVTSIDDYAFYSCSGLTSITIPNSVTSISQTAFSNCSDLTLITVELGNSKYDSRDNCNAIIETEPNSLISGCKNTIIPISVTSIGDYAFYSCSGLTSITIPNSVTSIGSSAFKGCYLRTIVAKQRNVEEYKDAFSDATYTHAMLYVPEGTFWDYVYVSKWGKFINIKEMANSAQEVRENQFYMLADAKGCNFAVYDEETASLKNIEYTFDLEEDKLGTYWKVEKMGSKARLYNQAAGKYAAVSATGEVSLSDTPVDLDITTENDAIKINGCEKMLVLNQNDEITAIGAVEINTADTDAPIYDLTGRSVQNASKGVYIKNGKKIMVK